MILILSCFFQKTKQKYLTKKEEIIIINIGVLNAEEQKKD